MSLIIDALDWIKINSSNNRAMDKTIDPNDPTPIVLPNNEICVRNFENLNSHRYRERFKFCTADHDAFATYIERYDSEYMLLTVDPDNMCAVALLNAWEPVTQGNKVSVGLGGHLPGHGDNKALCNLVPTAEWQLLLNLEKYPDDSVFSQSELLNFIREWNYIIVEPEKLIKPFSSVDLIKKVDRGNTVTESSQELSRSEKIALKANDAELPSEIQFHITPYDGFETRQIFVRVAPKLDDDKLQFTLKPLQVELVKKNIAQEFVGWINENTDAKAHVGRVHIES